MNVQIKELIKGAIPENATSGSAAYDLKAMLKNTVIVKPGESILIGTGIALNMQNELMSAIILPRSGLGSKGLVLGNLVGLIDSDYQGEIKVSCWNRSDNDIEINPNMRIAQLLFIPILKPNFKVVEEFSNTTVRKDQGFGHTGI